MAKSFILAGILLSVAVLQVVDGGRGSLKKEFYRSFNLVLTLSKMYREYEKVHESQGANESQPLLEEFVSTFERQFDNSDKRLYESLIEENGILDLTVKENKYHYRKTKRFLNFSRKVVNTALDLHHMYRSHQGNLTEMKNIERFRHTANSEMERATQRILAFLRDEAWKDQFILDIDETVEAQRGSSNLHIEVLKMLKDKYPFRSWFVMIRGADHYANNYICPLSDEPSYEEFIGERRDTKLVVVQVTRNYRQDKFYARMIMNNIATDLKYWTCKKNPAEEIFNESRYQCWSQRLAFFSILDVKRGITPRFASSDGSLLLSKTVTRSTWMGYCSTRYKVVIFA